MKGLLGTRGLGCGVSKTDPDSCRASTPAEGDTSPRTDIKSTSTLFVECAEVIIKGKGGGSREWEGSRGCRAERF